MMAKESVDRAFETTLAEGVLSNAACFARIFPQRINRKAGPPCPAAKPGIQKSPNRSNCRGVSWRLIICGLTLL